VNKPVENTQKHDFACSFYRASCGPEADIALLRPPHQLLRHLRHISPASGGYISHYPLRV
jgi:hypothetical protein